MLLGHSTAAASELDYVMPADLSHSLVLGKTLRNPFAATLAASHRNLKGLRPEPSEAAEGPVELRYRLQTIMFFSENSPRNRAVINGVICRPGDALTPPEGDSPIDVHEITQSEVRLRQLDPITGKVSIIRLRKSNARSATEIAPKNQ